LVAGLDPELEPELGRRLVERTQGSPMLLRLAVGSLRGDRAVDDLATQPEVAGYLLDTTVRGLAGGAERLAKLLAVIGRPVDLHDESLVELAADDLDWLQAAGELERRLLIDHPARAQLHPLVAEHLAARLAGDPPARRRLHRVAAAWL